jgi:predicted MPP superfamily phosphohydrolase
MSRRQFLKIAGSGTLAFGALGIGGAAYVTRVEPYHLDVTRVRVPLPHLPAAFEGYTIAHVSDFHMGQWITPGQLRTMVDTVNSLAPDLIAVTGDIASEEYPGWGADITHLLRAFRAPGGVAATLGNHDHWTHARTVRDAIRNAEAALLWNTHTEIRRGADTLYIVGVDDVWEREHDLDEALAYVPHGPVATILLAHEPDYADEVAPTGRIGLQLSGHSHGGQVRLPGIGAPVLPYLGRKYDRGLYAVNGMHLYVNRGIGMTSPYVRFNCPPEVTLLTLSVPQGTEPA